MAKLQVGRQGSENQSVLLSAGNTQKPTEWTSAYFLLAVEGSHNKIIIRMEVVLSFSHVFIRTFVCGGCVTGSGEFSSDEKTR